LKRKASPSAGLQEYFSIFFKSILPIPFSDTAIARQGKLILPVPANQISFLFSINPSTVPIHARG